MEFGMKKDFIKKLSKQVKNVEESDLAKLVKSYMGNKKGLAKMGFYASQLPYLECTRKEILWRLFGDDENGQIINSFGDTFIFNIGTAAHSWWQNQYLGPMQILIGEWTCSRCHHTVEDTTMPKDPCPECSWEDCANVCVWDSFGKDREVGQCNYKKSDRNCIECFEPKGRWRYVERRCLVEQKEIQINATGKTIKVPFEVSGYVDAFIKREKKLILADLKTKNSYLWKQLTAPDKKNVEQVNFMMGATGVHDGMLVYLEKEAWKIKQYEFSFDQKLYDKSMKKVYDVMYGLTYILDKLELSDKIENWDYVWKPFCKLHPLKKSDVISLLDEIFPSRLCGSQSCDTAKNCTQCTSCFLTQINDKEQVSWDIKTTTVDK